MNEIIRVENLTKFYGKDLILDSISLNVEKGSTFGLIGLSGSGKTTLLKLLIGFLKSDEGKVLFNKNELGEKISRLKEFKKLNTKENKDDSFFDIIKNKKLVNMTFGFATQEGSFYDKLTVAENIDYFGSLYDVPTSIKKKNAEFLIEMTGLNDVKNKLADELSEGMKKRLGIACSLVHNPSVLILDEPTADLDPTYRKQIWKLVKKINQNGTTIILASHLLDEVDEICSSVAIVHNKKILISGPPNQLKKLIKSNSEVIVDSLEQNYSDLSNQLYKELGKSIQKILVRDGKLVVYSDNGVKTTDAIIHIMSKTNKEVFSLQSGKPSMTEVFELLVSGKEK